MKIYAYLIVLGSLFGTSFAQQDYQLTHYMFDNLSFNPGYAGMNNNICGTMITREQWTGFQGNPSTKLLNVHSPVEMLRGGLGFSYINDQLGIEILGSKNQLQDDFKVIKTILNSAAKIKNKKIKVKVGDIGLFKKLVNSLDMPERWKLRLIRHFWRPKYFEELLDRLDKNSDIDSVTFDTDKKRFYEMKKMNQNKLIAGRSILEILKRFDKKIKDPRSFSEGKKIAKILRSFLKINCKLSELDKKLSDFKNQNNLKEEIFKDFKSIQNLKKLNQDIFFITNFGRNIEYYTGIVFEIFSGKKEIARGGRYDDLLKSLGAKKNIPAVGAAINLNNI